MMKRLLPVAAAVVIGLCPSFASAQGKVQNAKPQMVAKVKAKALADAFSATFASTHANGINLLNGRMVVRLGGGASFMMAGKGGQPYYASVDGITERKEGKRLNASADMDIDFAINSQAKFLSTFSIGKSMRAAYWLDQATNGNTTLAAGGGVDISNKNNDVRLENAYLAWNAWNHVVVTLGRHTAGMTTSTNVGSDNLYPRTTDLLESTTTEAGVRYDTGVWQVGVALLDPGTGAAPGDNSRGMCSGGDRKICNWIASGGYTSQFGQHAFMIHGKYMAHQEDLTFLEALNAVTPASARGDHRAWSLDGKVDFKPFTVSAFYVKLKKNANMTGGGGTWSTSDLKLKGLTVGYAMNDKLNFDVYYDHNSSTAAGMFKRGFGAKAFYKLAKHMDALAELQHNSDVNTNLSNAQNGTRGAIGVRVWS